MKILIAIPAYNGAVGEKTLTGVYETTRDFVREGISISLITSVNNSIIHHARSDLANFFINCTDATHILWVDADVGFHSEDVRKLVALETDFACGTYPKKTYPLRYTCALPKEGVVWNEERTAIEVAHVGAGFCLMTRHAYERIALNQPELRYVPTSESREVTEAEKNNSFHFYDTYTSSSGTLVGEDYAFCKRFRDAGGRIWLSPDIALTHVGNHVFTGHPLTAILGAHDDDSYGQET